MKKVICSSQSLSLKTPLKAMLVSSMILGSLLPLSVSAAEDFNDLEKPVYSETSDLKVNLLSNDSGNSNVNVKPDNDDNGKGNREDEIENQESSSDSSAIPISPKEVRSATSALEEVEERASESTQIKTQSIAADNKKAEKSPTLMSLEYLLGGGGLLLLLLGGGFLLLSKFNNLKNENQELSDENDFLKGQTAKNSIQLKRLENHNIQLKSIIESSNNTVEGQQSSLASVNTDASDLSSMPSLITPEAARIEDLNESDRCQLANIFENWLKTNRGNTKVDDLIPEDINKKLKHLHYTIELWGQGSGLDSVESTKNTMHTAVISLIKNDNKGYAYCYIKPNSMSSLWDNKAWYAVEKANGTLKLTGEPLEAN